jgi:hypothetical protein
MEVAARICGWNRTDGAACTRAHAHSVDVRPLWHCGGAGAGVEVCVWHARIGIVATVRTSPTLSVRLLFDAHSRPLRVAEIRTLSELAARLHIALVPTGARATRRRHTC